ncbi:MAG: Transcription elongation factor GreA [uncultured Paraburkholderia sp.]|nr:MAG: Transcription elongation factor GreA [uncultured Paraburkholderia sp.]
MRRGAQRTGSGPAFSRELFMSTIPLTKRGADMLRDELQRLKSVERPAVINSI